MPELRQDPLSQRWIIISSERAKRPNDFKLRPVEPHVGECVFCAGNENKTPPEIWAYRSPGTERDQDGWWVRTVPNKFPALGIEGSLNEHMNGLHKSMNGVGAHEVIIETPRHQIETHQHSVEQMQEIIRMWRDRHLDLRQDKRLKYVMVFKNEGSDAGASLEHSHSQLIALPILPKAIEEEIDGIKRHLEAANRCIFCDMIEQEKQDYSRMVFESESMIAFCPYASRFPFEIWILPKRHEPDFGFIRENEIQDLGITLQEVLARLAGTLGSPPYNLLLHSTPVNTDIGVSYHWHIEILPRLTKAAGFEFGTDYYINPTPPEIAADSLQSFH
ncbi:MAG: galactose-1-phosphate uridylyltransferase [Syntrophomonadaceae bacterium]|nr:galactose-1-phosphate uridylyltransferase [Syntrophomonadaceae bacterium]